MNQLENDLQNLIAKHAAQLSGEEWRRACDTVGRAHFAGLAEQGELADQFANALRGAVPLGARGAI